MPEPIKLTVEAKIEHTVLLAASIVKVTGCPEPPPLAATAYVGPPTVAQHGAVEVNVIASEPLPTANSCSASAAVQTLLPDALAMILHVPTPMKLTVA
jgi:hypothetical protein